MQESSEARQEKTEIRPDCGHLFRDLSSFTLGLIQTNAPLSEIMDLTFILSAIIFTLLAIVVATSLFNSTTSSADLAMGYFGHRGDAKAGGLGKSAASQNGHVPDKNAVDDWSELTGSHDHWDVVKSVLSEETHPHPHTEELAASVEHSTSTSSPSDHRPASREMSLDVDSSPEASTGRSRSSFIGLSDKELLKCAFSHPQTEGATESPASNDKAESDGNNSLKYIPGKARTSHLQMMMSNEELEEERRVQREQLAAIFQLLKDNKETFGEVSEGDIEEQLKLYSI